MNTDAIDTRFELAKTLIARGADDEATELCVELWTHNSAWAGFHWLPPTIRPLVQRHEAARAAFTRIRDEMGAPPFDRRSHLRWMQLSDVLDDGAPVLRWLATTTPEVANAFAVTIDSRVHQFVERADAWAMLGRLVDVDWHLREAHALIEEMEGADHATLARAFIRGETFVQPRRALIAAGRHADAARLAEF